MVYTKVLGKVVAKVAKLEIWKAEMTVVKMG
jgi:hypothetical protein